MIFEHSVQLSTEFADMIKGQQFPDERELKCYVNCVLEMMRVSKKGKLLYDAGLKQINTMLPENMRADYVAALDACREAGKGLKDNCDAAYEMIQCFMQNNPVFIFP